MKSHNTERGGNGLGKQIAGKGHSDITGSQSGFSDCKPCGFFLKSAFCCLPGLGSEERVLGNHVKKVSKRAVSFFLSGNSSCDFNVYRLFKGNAGASCQFSGSHTITSISLRI